jgi:hypothetical protein
MVALARCLTQAKPIQSYNSGLGFDVARSWRAGIERLLAGRVRPVELQIQHPSPELGLRHCADPGPAHRRRTGWAPSTSCSQIAGSIQGGICTRSTNLSAIPGTGQSRNPPLGGVDSDRLAPQSVSSRGSARERMSATTNEVASSHVPPCSPTRTS